MTSNADTAGIAANQLFPAAKAAAATHGIQPRSQLFAATTVPIRADSFRWERYPTVEVAVRYDDDANGIHQNASFVLSSQTTDIMYQQLGLLLDGLETVLAPLPDGCVAKSIEKPPAYGIFATGRVVGHVSLHAAQRGDPWPPTCDWIRARP